jgi:hypothetical protein
MFLANAGNYERKREKIKEGLLFSDNGINALRHLLLRLLKALA